MRWAAWASASAVLGCSCLIACNPHTDALPAPMCRTQLDCSADLMCRKGRCGRHGHFAGKLYFRHGRLEDLERLELEVVRASRRAYGPPAGSQANERRQVKERQV